MKQIQETNYLSLDQASKMLHVSHQTLRNWTDQRIDGYQTEGGHRRYLERDVKVVALQESMKAQGNPEFKTCSIQASLIRRGDVISIGFFHGQNLCLQEALTIEPKSEWYPMSFDNDDCWETRLEEQIIQGQKAAYEVSAIDDLRLTREYFITDQWVMAMALCQEDAVGLIRKGIQEAHDRLASLEFVYGVCGVKRTDGVLLSSW